MKHALFVAFHYPPDGSSSGVLRTLKYTRYLADHGWRVTVVAPDPSAYESIDTEMSKQVPYSARVIRTRYWNSKRHFGIRGRYSALSALPDVWIGWFPWAVAAGVRAASADPVDLIYSTSPPATAHLIAKQLAKRLGKPYVIDLRDPWFEEPAEPGAPSGALYRSIDRWLERKAIESSAHVVTTTDAVRDALIARYPQLAPECLSVIPNGYDEADFVHQFGAGNARGDRFVIVHAGSINPCFRDPVPILRAIRSAADSGWLDPERMCLRFLGGGPYAASTRLADAVAETGLQGCVQFVPRLPYLETLEELARADVLLLLQASDDTCALVPAKLYEYLRMRKPLLALVLPGETTRLLEKTGGGVAVDPADHALLVTELARLYRAWRDGTLNRAQADLAIVRHYDRRELTRNLAAIFDAVAKR